MASTAAVAAMSKRPPQDYTDLMTAVGKPEGSMLRVIGVVSDWMPPGPTRGEDFQMTFTLNDTSLLANGFRVKFFRKEKDLPFIRDAGDVVILRNIKLKTFNGGPIGLSSYATEHIVFPRDSIVSPELRVKYMVHGNYLRHHKSDKADNPSIAEQQWVITLHDRFKSSYQPPSSAPAAPRSMRSDVVRKDEQLTKPGDVAQGFRIRQHDKEIESNQPGRWDLRVTTQRDKFSLLQDVKIVDKGSFYDLIGVVVKLFYNTYSGILELYLSDYTTNDILHNLVPEMEDFSGSKWHSPTGKMVIQVELSPPHGPWAQANTNVGDFVFLKNVRIKYNNHGEAVGTMWLDQYYPDKVSIFPLNATHPQYDELVVRKHAYEARIEHNISLKKRSDNMSKHKRRQKKKLRKQQLKAMKLERKNQRNDDRLKRERDGVNIKDGNDKSAESSGLDGDFEPDDDSDSDSEPDQRTTKRAKISNGKPLSRHIINSNVICNYPDIPLSTFSEILHNPHRLHTTPNGTKYDLPFINVRHRAHFRVVDYYPHQIHGFCKHTSHPSNRSQQLWQWDFWLVLQSGGASDPGTECINCHVAGEDAQELLGLPAQDLTPTLPGPRRALDNLTQTLFLLWGELAEKKDAFLAAHPHIPADADFSAVKYHITTDALPIEACVAEFGVEVVDAGEDDRAGGEDGGAARVGNGGGDVESGDGRGAGRRRWERVYKLVDTRIDR